MKLSSLTLSLLALVGVASFAQTPPTASVTSKAGATVLTETTIERKTNHDKGPGSGFNKLEGIDLYFGRFTKPTADVTAILKPDATYGTKPDGYKDGAYTPGYELTTGEANMAVLVSGPATGIDVTSGTNKMSVTNFTFKLAGGAGEGTDNASGTNGAFVSSTNKKVHFNVGATLTLKKDQAPGLYTGTYLLTAAYN